MNLELRLKEIKARLEEIRGLADTESDVEKLDACETCAVTGMKATAIAIAAVIATAVRIFFLNDCFMISPVFFQSAVLTLPPALPPEVLASGNGIPVFRDGRNELDSLLAAGDIVRKEQHALGLDAAKLSRLQVRHDDDLLSDAVFRFEVLGYA